MKKLVGRRLLTYSRKMSEKLTCEKTTHLERTANSSRNQETSQATVSSIRNESSNVKGLTLTVKNKQFTHKAGQWVDTIIPGIETVGGFSICSPPSKIVREGKFDLAVKCSNHPPAHWIHHECKVGDEVQVRVGGDFFHDPGKGLIADDVILIAGGVGINPLFSILQHIADIRQSSTSLTTLLYSAKTDSDFIFKRDLDRMNSRCEYTTVTFNTTKTKSQDPDIKFGRISEEDIRNVVIKSDKKKITGFICGPLPMIEDMSEMFKNCGIDSSKIHFEKWW